jgi:hypothetical protein
MVGNAPFVEGHDGRALVGENGLVRVHAGVQLGAQLPRLDNGAGMAVVEKVKAAVDPDAALEDLRGWFPLEAVLVLEGGHSRQ